MAWRGRTTTALRFAVIAVAAAFLPVSLLTRLLRNAFTPAIPRAVEPLYASVDDDRLAHDVTVVVGTKDTLSPTIAQLRHLSQALPAGVRVIYTYPLPPWEEAKDYAARLRDAAGPHLVPNLRLLPVDGFSNPFDAWLKALPFVRTKYTLLMHNDVFLLDGKGHLLSELHGALETHPAHAVAAPQIYETEVAGLLTTHLFNTNLHLRRNAEGVAFMSHEVDLLAGLAREPSDFSQRPNDNFLEDHCFLARTEAVRGTEFLDPHAAFTLEYVDLHLNMLRANLTQLYVPTARAEFRLWEVGWQDVPYFVRRRSEEQARLTKRHLEAKWGVEFPNTGFCNFVKFSIIRHVSLQWTDLPTRWVDQASLLVAWFEMVGFNRQTIGLWGTSCQRSGSRPPPQQRAATARRVAGLEEAEGRRLDPAAAVGASAARAGVAAAEEEEEEGCCRLTRMPMMPGRRPRRPWRTRAWVCA